MIHAAVMAPDGYCARRGADYDGDNVQSNKGTMTMATTENTTNTDHHPADTKVSLYRGMMDFGFGVGLPVGGAITFMIAMLLAGMNPIIAIVLSVVVGVALRIFSKAFFVHGH
ncbi:hypothetical protein [Parvularcula sp. LCG005]|uniref:hypothetical protein n=1 Tax=Parvularcula sp. LCG005 TaxID=3078805 RepID=UPI002941F934|nr:hypothetical protein [Parvularcula sp. LCG005]WOI52318.1 hypothetical protein RUI03_09155 [Parvularcula sp. LCG005]